MQKPMLKRARKAARKSVDLKNPIERMKFLRPHTYQLAIRAIERKRQNLRREIHQLFHEDTADHYANYDGRIVI